jgi:AmiR/NasT family two-component response regulator
MEVDQLRVVLASSAARTRARLKDMLLGLGYSLVGDTSDGQSAIQLAMTLRPDVVLLDTKLLGLSAAQAAQAIAQGDYAAVVLSAGPPDRQLASQAAALGAAAWLLKPVNERKLLATMEIAAARFRAATCLRSQIADLREQIATERLVQRAKATLMAEHGLTEADAMQRLQNLADRTGKTTAAASELIVLAARSRAAS